RLREVARAGEADLARTRAHDADARVGLAHAVVRIAVLAVGAEDRAAGARVVAALAVRAHLVALALTAARVAAAHSELAGLAGRTRHAGAARHARAGASFRHTILVARARHAEARVALADAVHALLTRATHLRERVAVVRQTDAGLRDAHEPARAH